VGGPLRQKSEPQERKKFTIRGKKGRRTLPFGRRDGLNRKRRLGVKKRTSLGKVESEKEERLSLCIVHLERSKWAWPKKKKRVRRLRW